MPMFVGLLRPQRAKHRLARASAALLLAASATAFAVKVAKAKELH